jgi:gliding motility-associated-like protein
MKRIIWTIWIALRFTLAMGQVSNPTVAPCDGLQYICADSSALSVCVNIIVDPDDPSSDSIAYYQISWGDQSNPTVLSGDMPPPPQWHTYDLSEYWGGCQYEVTFVILLETFPSSGGGGSNGEPTNSTFLLTVRFPPSNTIGVAPFPCFGEPTTLQGSVSGQPQGQGPNCPGAGILYESWEYPLGSGNLYPGNLFQPVFDSIGLYNVGYCVGNTCDTICSSHTVEVFAPPAGSVTPGPTLSPVGTGHFRLCMEADSAAYASLDGNISLYQDSFSWAVSGPAGGWAWYPDPSGPDSGLAVIRFTLPGTYTVAMEVSNECQQTDIVETVIDVVLIPHLTLKPQEDTCGTISYTPTPWLAEVDYTINGTAWSAFPAQLPIAAQPYIIRATWPHVCGLQSLADTFVNVAIPGVQIFLPADDPTVCLGSDPIELIATPGSEWLGDSVWLITNANGTFFQPGAAGHHEVYATLGFGVCRSYDTIGITVDAPYPLQLDTPAVGCVSVDFTPSPFDPTVRYTLNGVQQDSFPITLSHTQSPYFFAADHENSCGFQALVRTLHVILPEAVRIFPETDTALCENPPPLLLQASDSIGTWSGPSLQAVPNGVSFQANEPGSYTILFERGSGQCYASDTLQITIVPADTVSAGEDRYLCGTLGQYVLEDAHPAGGIFSGQALSGDTVWLEFLDIDSSYHYQYLVPNLPAGCNSAAIQLVRLPPAVATFELSRDTACQGETVTVLPAGPVPSDFVLAWGDGTVGDSLLTHSYSETGSYPIRLIAYTLNPLDGSVICEAEHLDTIVIPSPLPPGSVDFTLQPSEGCAPLTVGFLSTGTAVEGPYRWDFGNGQVFLGADPPPVTYSADSLYEATTFEVWLSIPNACGEDSASQSLTVAPLPRALFSLSNQAPCSGQSFTAQPASTGDPTAQFFLTDAGDQIPVSNGETVSFQLLTGEVADTFGIRLVAINECGADTAYQTLTVVPTDVSALAGLPDTSSLCVGDTAIFRYYGSPLAPFHWVDASGNTYAGDTLRFPLDSTGPYSLTLYTFGCGYDSVTFSFGAYPLPTLSVAHDTAVCADQPVLFLVSTDAPSTTLWYGDGTVTQAQASVHAYPGPGTYHPYAIAQTEKGCETTWQANLTIHPLPAVQAMANQPICTGAEAEFSSTSDPAGGTCTWNFGDGYTGSDCQAVHSYDAPGWYPVMLTLLSANGCTGKDTLPVFVHETPLTTLQLDTLDPCFPMRVAFQQVTTGATDLSWLFSDGFTTHEPGFQYQFDGTGDIMVTLLATNGNWCRDTASLLLSLPGPVLFGLEQVPNCTVSEGTDLSVLTDPAHSVLLEGDGMTATGTFHPGLPPGDYQLQVTDPNGCHKDTQLLILPVRELQIQVVRDTFDLYLGEQATLGVVANLPEAEFQWDPADYLDDDRRSHPVSSPPVSVRYLVYVTDGAGCVKADTVWVRVSVDREAGIFIPNAFTPNTDGVNDILYLRSANRSVRRIDHFRVYDKYQEIVFDLSDVPGSADAVPENPYFGWDGNFRGKKAEAGTYRYTAAVRMLDDTVQSFSGKVQLIR